MSKNDNPSQPTTEPTVNTTVEMIDSNTVGAIAVHKMQSLLLKLVACSTIIITALLVVIIMMLNRPQPVVTCTSEPSIVTAPSATTTPAIAAPSAITAQPQLDVVVTTPQ